MHAFFMRLSLRDRRLKLLFQACRNRKKSTENPKGKRELGTQCDNSDINDKFFFQSSTG